MADTVNEIGYYCGRFAEGLLGEPHNSLTNLAFVAVALWAVRIWQQSGTSDPLILAVILAGGSIGLGSLVFHSHPTPATLQIDLWPIQIFGLLAIFTVALRVFGLSLWGAGLAVIGFFAVRQLWSALLHPGRLGGGISHIPSLAALLLCAVLLRRRGHPIAPALFWAAGVYFLALNARAADLMYCEAFPLGTHWLWHLMTACVVGCLLIGLARHGRVLNDPR